MAAAASVPPIPRDPLWLKALPLLLLAAAAVAVVVAPELRVHLLGAGANREHAVQYAGAAAVISACSVGYLYLVWRNNSLPGGWVITMAAYNLVIILIKFVFSPTVFSRSGTSLGQFIGIGLGVGVLYFAGLGVVALGVEHSSSRHDGVPWRWKIGMVVAVGIIATLGSLLIGPFTNTLTSAYLLEVFSSSGLRSAAILLVALLLTATLAVQAFEYGSKEARDGSGRNGNAATLWTASVLLLAYQGLWVIFMVRLFS
jgi:hypothetical protein